MSAILYDGREQSLVKHHILRSYLCDFAHKVGFGWDSITYVDCFSGPWNVQSKDLTDSSFAIALSELRRARATLEGKGRPLGIRCFFLEKDPDAFAQLEQFGRAAPEAEVRTVNLALEDAVGQILEFVGQGGKRTFPFLFIDPTGWSGLDMDTIRPLLQLNPCEVLINFMTGFVSRFVRSDDPQTTASFDRFFGGPAVRMRAAAMDDPQKREDELFLSYAGQVQEAGGYAYSSAAIVLRPKTEQSFFHLIYATRSHRGLEVFKPVEQAAMHVMEQVRAGVLNRGEAERSGQPGLFLPEHLPWARRLDGLRDRYLDRARTEAEKLRRQSSPVLYDRLWGEAMRFPLVWDSDVKGWIDEWLADGTLEIQGMKLRQRVPHLNESNWLVWRDPAPIQRNLFD